MGQAIGQELVYAVGIAISPFAIVGVVLMLGTPQARSNGPAFVAGWIAGLALAGTVVLLIAGGAGADDGVGESDWVDGLKLLLGVVLVVVGIRKRRSGRSRAEEVRELPGWMRTVDRFTAGRAAATAAGLAALNPKNLILIVAAATAIAETGASTGAQAVAMLVFVLVGTLGAGIPVLLYLMQGERARGRLDGIRDWMVRHNGAVVAVLCIVIGAKLIGEAISGFSA
jgi:threonine/homoserine/homoserine lactone efflux protein